MIKKRAAWYEVGNVIDIPSPALLVYPDRIKKNIQQVLHMVGSPERIRPHIKTCKSIEPIKLMLEAGIKQFKCATIAEAELLALAGAPDVLLAYQPVGPNCSRFIQLMKVFPETSFSCIVDHPSIVHTLSTLASAASVMVNVYIDVNVGMNRSGIPVGSDLMLLQKLLETEKSLSFAGLHVYDGHIHDASLDVRRNKCLEYLKPILSLYHELNQQATTPLKVIAGGSPTFPILAEINDVVCSPGTFIYWDAGYQTLYPEQALLPAAVLITRVVSKPSADHICLDLGHKSVAAENSLDRRLILLNSDTVKPLAQSEEHLVLTGQPEEIAAYTIGDLFYALPNHICPTVALYNEVIPVIDGKANGSWPTIARNRVLHI